MNSTGLAIWELLDGERTVAEIVAAVRARLDEPPSTLEDEVVDFLGRLTARGLALG